MGKLQVCSINCLVLSIWFYLFGFICLVLSVWFYLFGFYLFAFICLVFICLVLSVWFLSVCFYLFAFICLVLSVWFYLFGFYLFAFICLHLSNCNSDICLCLSLSLLNYTGRTIALHMVLYMKCLSDRVYFLSPSLSRVRVRSLTINQPFKLPSIVHNLIGCHMRRRQMIDRCRLRSTLPYASYKKAGNDGFEQNKSKLPLRNCSSVHVIQTPDLSNIQNRLRFI